MKLSISTSAVGSFAKLAITARVVFGVLIDMPELLNAGWLSILLGGILALPLACALSKLRFHRSEIPRACLDGVYMVFFAIAVSDAAVVTAGIADSASYLALNSAPSAYLMIPLFFLCFFCLRLNADAVGASAAIWGKVLPWLIAIVVLLQIGEYQPQWLTPVLGPGIPPLLTGAVRIAGWLALPSALCLVSQPDDSLQLQPVKILGCNIFLSAFLAVISGMMTPAIQSENLFTRAFRLDILLANGRSGLSLQFPAIALWYVSLFYALLFDVTAAAVLLQSLLTRWNGHACLCFTLVVTALFSFSKLSTQGASLRMADWLFPLQGLLIALVILSTLFHRRKKRHA